MLAVVMVGSAMDLALGPGKLSGWDIGLTAGVLAGSMTPTPVTVAARNTLGQTPTIAVGVWPRTTSALVTH